MRSLITGISGQDGSYLAKLLLEKGYEVYGAERRSASSEHWRLKKLGILDKVKMVPFELLEQSNIVRTLEKVQPDEIYNLGAMSFVGTSFDQPVYTCDVNGLGVIRLLDAVRQVCPKAKLYQASTSEMFGLSKTYSKEKSMWYQDENTPFHPRSPYGCAKLLAHTMVVNYREAYKMFACSGILFNHESPLRGEEFVTRKITKTLTDIDNKICSGVIEIKPLELGNMNAQRDWGHAKDFVRGMWMILQSEIPDDYVLATGKTRSVRDFVKAAGKALGWTLRWEGSELEERAYLVTRDKKEILVVKVNSDFYRPSDVEYLCGSPEKAKTVLGWEPEYDFQQLVTSMIDHELSLE